MEEPTKKKKVNKKFHNNISAYAKNHLRFDVIVSSA